MDAEAQILIEELVHNPQDPSAAIQAWLKLRAMGPQAFPVIIEHLEDKRKSFTADGGSTDRTWTVGWACFDLLWCSLEPYNELMYSNSVPERHYWWRPEYATKFLDTREKAQAWLAKHKDKTLAEVQIEILEWILSNDSGRKYNSPLEDFEVEQMQADKARLAEKLEELGRTQRPLKPGWAWSR